MSSKIKPVSTHRHIKHGDGYILSWYDNDQVMFQSNHGRHFVQESSLSPIAPRANSPVVATSIAEVPELPSQVTEQEVRDRLEALVQEPAIDKPELEEAPELKEESASGLLNLNKVAAAKEISTAFPQLGKVGAKKLYDKRPIDGWVSVSSIREFAGELFPTEESWNSFASVVEV